MCECRGGCDCGFVFGVMRVRVRVRVLVRVRVRVGR